MKGLKILRTLTGHKGSITSILLSENFLTSSSEDASVRIWKFIQKKSQSKRQVRSPKRTSQALPYFEDLLGRKARSQSNQLKLQLNSSRKSEKSLDKPYKEDVTWEDDQNAGMKSYGILLKLHRKLIKEDGEGNQ